MALKSALGENMQTKIWGGYRFSKLWKTIKYYVLKST